MNKSKKSKTVKRVLLITIPILIIAAGIGLYMLWPIVSMMPAETGFVEDTNILAVRNARNAVYFMQTPEGYILVDTGSDPEGLSRLMRENGINAEDVKWVLLTHSDYDHVGSRGLFTNAEIIEPIEPDAEEKELNLGGINIQCIKTPGHRANHTAYLADGKYLFTGDALRHGNGTLSVHPFSDDAAESEKSIALLKGIMAESELVLTGHYGYFTYS